MEPAESVKSLGVIPDADNSMQRHVANLCHACYYHLKKYEGSAGNHEATEGSAGNHEAAVKVAFALVSVQPPGLL